MQGKELPKYMALVKWIKEQVAENQLQYGDKFYSENELSAMFGISRQTVRQAVGILEQEKIVERRRGSGTYITYTTEVKREITRNIGVVTTYIDDYIFTSIIRGIETVLAQNGYTMQLAFTHNRVENETRALRLMLDKGVDGLIVEPTKSGLPSPNGALYCEIEEKKIPLIFINAYYPGMNFPHVAMDDTKAGYLAAQQLVRAGHNHIGGIFQSDDLQGHLRYAGYVKALMDAGLELRDENVLWYTTEDMADFTEDARRVLRRMGESTGVVCYNDKVSMSLVDICKKNGVAVPERLSISSIDNSDLAALCEVPLTSVAHPMQLLGETAAQNLMKLIGGKRFDATVEFTPQVVERMSIRCMGG